MDPYIGEIRVFSFSFAPKDWLDCDGRLVSTDQYTKLFSLLGYRYGGEGRSFALPDLRDTAALCQGQGQNLSPYKLGDKGGTAEVTLKEQDLPVHTHQGYSNREPAEVQAPGPDRVLAHSTPGNAYQGPADLVRMNAQTASIAGSGAPHNNMPPAQVLRFCIAYEGEFPPRGQEPPSEAY